MNTIDEIIKATNKPSITDISAIERIVTRLAEQPAKLFKCKTSEPLLGVVSDFLMDCEMDKSRYLDVLFGEVLGIIELVPSIAVYCDSFGETNCRNMRLTLLAHIRNILLEFDCKNDTVHLFMSITVKGYFDCLSQKSEANNSCYDEFCQKIKRDMDFEISDNTTIKQFIEKACSVQSQKWTPAMPINKFKRNIRRSYEDLIACLLFISSRLFPNILTLQGLKKNTEKRRKQHEYTLPF